MKPIFARNLNIRVPAGFIEAVSSAAAEDARTASEFIRSLTIAELRRRGVKPFSESHEARAA